MSRSAATQNTAFRTWRDSAICKKTCGLGNVYVVAHRAREARSGQMDDAGMGSRVLLGHCVFVDCALPLQGSSGTAGREPAEEVGGARTGPAGRLARSP